MARQSSHTLKVNIDSFDNLRFQDERGAGTVAGISQMLSEEDLHQVQIKNTETKLVKNYVVGNIPINNWRDSCRSFTRYASKLSVINGILVFNDGKPIPVISHSMVVDVALLLQFKFGTLVVGVTNVGIGMASSEISNSV